MATTDQPLAGRRILVTGASRGIGEASARALAPAGARVALLGRSAAPLEESGQELGGLDGLINAAGVVRPGRIGETPPEDWQLTFHVNVRGLLHVTQAALPARQAAGRADRHLRRPGVTAGVGPRQAGRGARPDARAGVAGQLHSGVVAA